MKKIIIIAILSSFCLTSFSQLILVSEMSFLFNKDLQKDIDKFKNSKVRELKVYYGKYTGTNNREDEKPITIYQYKNNGFIYSKKTIKPNGNIGNTNTITFDSIQGHSVETSINSKGKITSKTRREFSDSGRTLKWESGYNRRTDGFRTKTVYQYTEDNKMASMSNYRHYGNKLWNKWVYEYFPNGDPKRSTRYNGKGVVKYTINYECKTDTLLTASVPKKSAEICIFHGYDKDGYKIKVFRKTDGNGNILKKVGKFDENDQMIEISEFDTYDNLLRTWALRTKENPVDKFTAYHKKTGKSQENNYSKV